MFSQIPKMSSAGEAISKNLSGFGSSESRYLPCSGGPKRAVSSCGEYKHFPQVKTLNLKSTFRSISFVCNASSSSHRKNSDFSRQNKHGFYRNRNRQSEDRDGYENFEESDMLSSKNGPMHTASNTSKFQTTATPGPREKEIVELFRKVQAQLRERAALKEEKKVEELQGKGKENETVDSLLKLLRKHSVQKGKKPSSNNFVRDQSDQSGVLSEERASNILELNSNVNHEAQERGTAVNRAKSIFQRRSPVPRVKFQPLYSEQDTVKPVASTSIDRERREIYLEPELHGIPESKVDSDIEPDTELSFSAKDVFGEMSEDDATKIYENINGDGGEEEPQAEHDELAEMKLTELRAIAKSRGLKGYSKLKKVELIELLSGGHV